MVGVLRDPLVIAELLGVPAERRGDFKRWSDDLVLFIDGSIRDQGLAGAAKAALRGEPRLLATAVDELLRFDPPVQLTSRIAREDLEVAGHRVAAGEEVNLLLAAANRDPAVFPAPHRLDLARSDNPHLSFGHGSHFCLGASLARLEAQAAFRGLLDRFPRLALPAVPLRRRPGMVLRGLGELPLALS